MWNEKKARLYAVERPLPTSGTLHGWGGSGQARCAVAYMFSPMSRLWSFAFHRLSIFRMSSGESADPATSKIVT